MPANNILKLLLNSFLVMVIVCSATYSSLGIAAEADKAHTASGNKILPVEVDIGDERVVVETVIPGSNNIDQMSEEELRRWFADLIPKQGHSGAFRAAAHEFTPEFATFSAVQGLIIYLVMAERYHGNPLEMRQELMSFKNPVTYLSFYMFMVANRYMGSLLTTMVKNPFFAKYIAGYVSMSFGMLASHFTSELLEPLKECAVKLIEEEFDNNRLVLPNECVNAYSEFVLKDKILDMAPSMASMLVSSALSGAGEWALSKAIKNEITRGIKRHVIKWAGVDLAMMFTPGGLMVKSGKVLLKAGKIGSFLAIDRFLVNPLFVGAYKNIHDAGNLEELSSNLITKVLELKNVAWQYSEPECAYQAPLSLYYSSNSGYTYDSKPCDNSFAHDLKEFQAKMGVWRQYNLTGPFTAYMSWQEKLLKVTSAYSSTQEFYSFLINEIVVAKKRPDTKLNHIYYLNGVTPATNNGKPYAPEGLTKSFSQSELYQLDNIKLAIDLINEQMNMDMQNSKVTESERNVYKRIKECLEYGVQQTDLAQKQKWIAEGLSMISELQTLDRDLMSPAQKSNTKRTTHYIDAYFHREGYYVPVRDRMQLTEPFKNVLLALTDLIGYPDPKLVPGAGLLYAYMVRGSKDKDIEDDKVQVKWIEDGEMLKAADFPTHRGFYKNLIPTEYLALSMICGEDVVRGHSTIEKSRYFQDRFLAPKITSGETDVLCNGSWTDLDLRDGDALFTTKITKDTVVDEKQSYQGIIEYLKNNLNSSSEAGVIDAKTGKSMFSQWWQNRVEPDIERLLKKYNQSYSLVLAGFTDAMKIRSKVAFNSTQMANGIVESIRQESRLYLMILNELLKDTIASDLDSNSTLKFSEAKPALRLDFNLIKAKAENFPLMSVYLQSPPYDLNEIIAALTNFTSSGSVALNTKLTSQAKGSLEIVLLIDKKIQEVLRSFESVRYQKGKVANNDYTEEMAFLQTPDSMEEVSKTIEELNKDLKATEALLASQYDANLNEFQKLTIKVCFENLNKLSGELIGYSAIYGGITAKSGVGGPKNVKGVKSVDQQPMSNPFY